jgi:hypothetical protein
VLYTCIWGVVAVLLTMAFLGPREGLLP